MKHAWVYMLTLTAISVFPNGCDSPITTTDNGSYRYLGYDSLHSLVVDGYLSIEFVDSIHVKGNWHLTPTAKATSIGPQSGSGQLAGIIESKEIARVNLNPAMIDNNVILLGTLRNDSFAGTWDWVSFIGITNKGTFVARRNVPFRP